MITPTAPVSAVPSDAKSTREHGHGQGATGTFARLAAHSPAGAADSVWVPLVSGTLILVAGAMSLATGKPWLFAALGPSAVLIAANPGHPTTRFHTIVLGHLTALACGWIAVLLLGAGGTPAVVGAQAISVSRVWASAFAVAITALVQPSLKAYHPPAAATAILVTMGVYRTNWQSALSMIAGVLAVALVGEWLQRVRLEARPARRDAA